MGVLEVNNVSIRYLTGDFKDIGLKEYTMRKLKRNYHVQEFWADRDVTFSLERGDMLGIIGINGAGKSTLLKVISGIMEPSEGYVKREGNVAALLELASGFDGELTVRENTYLRGAMLGYTRSFMDEKYNEIISFAELADFQDRPFRQLSSGMQSRLAFSIASLVQPDLLILDEVLSVGDGAFQQKSAEKMREIIRSGATTIFVSHSIDQVETLCNKVLWLHQGEQIAFGDTAELCGLYRRFLTGDVSMEAVQALLPKEAVAEKPIREISAITSDEQPYVQPQVSAKPKSAKERTCTICLFILSFALVTTYIAGISPISISGDAQSIWQSIVGIANGTPVASYVMYKGIMSCYPYVWFYQLSKLLRLSDFFFFKLYHGILFAYVTTIAVPCVVEYLFRKRPRVWQIFLFSVTVFVLWKPTLAFDQLMVDLPCCSFFFFAIHMAIHLKKLHKGYCITALVAGLACGFNSTASGQYNLAMLCILLFSLVQIMGEKKWGISKKRRLIYILTLLIGYAIPYVLNGMFVANVVNPLRNNGVWIPNGEFWLQRGLLYKLPYVEAYPFRHNARGIAILEGIYGSAEAANAVWTAAAAAAQTGVTGIGWTIPEWFAAFARYPLDFLVLILDKAFICVTTDAMNGNLGHLLVGYTLLYLALVQMLKYTSKIKNVFQRKSLLVISALLTILPSVVMTVEPRNIISLQGLIFGTALMGPVLESGEKKIISISHKLANREINKTDISNCAFPWALLVGIFFVWVCFAHYGDLMAHTYSGIDLLFNK